MKRFKNILYILNNNSIGQQDSAEKVSTLARLNDARVSVVIVEDSSLFQDIGMILSGHLQEIRGITRQQHQKDLDGFLANNLWRDINVNGSVLTGKDFLVIIQKVLTDKHDLVIKEETLEAGIDPLAMRLVRKCPCPVWVIKRGATKFRRILGAVDVGAEFAETQELNKKIVELTFSLAQREQGEAHYLHTWRLEYEVMLRGPRFSVAPEEILKLKQTLSEQRHSGLQKLLDSVNVSAQPDHVHIREGESEALLNQLINAFEIDVVVMGSIGRSGIPGFLIGNRAEKMLSKINCTVLTVKPDGFISPITI
ncbi:MAG: universal stress protein [Desulfobacterales bacterium]|nr:universal stress protein [Deltaproteobacteria bacterium]NNK95179.1 universal stress protein [Desulfobacterales bacterium]